MKKRELLVRQNTRLLTWYLPKYCIFISPESRKTYIATVSKFFLYINITGSFLEQLQPYRYIIMPKLKKVKAGRSDPGVKNGGVSSFKKKKVSIINLNVYHYN